MAALKVLEELGQLLSSGVDVELEYAIDDMIRPRLICGIELAWLRCWFEWPQYYSCRVRANVERLASNYRRPQRGGGAIG